MSQLHKQHLHITTSIKKQIEPLQIVFPSQYGRLYTELARSLNIELSPDEILDSEMLNEKLVTNIITLASCTEQAIEAIESEDKKTLQAVLAETKMLREEIQELQKVIYEDTLTKCYNRKWFEDTYLDSNYLTMRMDGIMAIIDLNKFKFINDTYGHTIGDKILVHVATKLKETGGNVVRYGGDEFLVIFDSAKLSSKITDTFDGIIFDYSKKSFKVNKESFKVSFAYGLAQFTHGSDLNSIIDIADEAMYRHKKEN